MTDLAHDVSHTGGCHCGALSLAFHSAKPVAPRACGCSFCRRHGVRSVSDNEGRALIQWEPGVEPIRYRFGLRTADFLICPACGIYVAAVIGTADGLYAVLNLNAFDDPHLDIAATPMDYEGESVEQRQARRRRVWTPTELREREGGEAR
jgi:hypothetical protein